MAMCPSLKGPGFSYKSQPIVLHPQKTGAPTRSRHDPPPRYSITIHSLYPLKKLVLYCVTNGLAQVLSTEISCWISCISSSLDSRSIYGGCQSVSTSATSSTSLTCLMATTSPVARSIALYTTPKLPPSRRVSVATSLAQKRKLTAQFLEHLILVRK